MAANNAFEFKRSVYCRRQCRIAGPDSLDDTDIVFHADRSYIRIADCPANSIRSQIDAFHFNSNLFILVLQSKVGIVQRVSAAIRLCCAVRLLLGKRKTYDAFLFLISAAYRNNDISTALSVDGGNLSVFINGYVGGICA